MESLLYVEDLTVSFDGFLALRKLNLIVESGERIRLLIGPNGAGKTTFFDVLTGGVRPTAGRVVFGERTSLPELSTHAIAALGVCRKFQTPSVFPGHTVLENMILAAGRKGFAATLAAGTSGGDRQAIAAVLEQVGLREEAGRPAGTLAHGQKQWLEIAMLLMESPTLLLLDEPVAGMTRPEKEKTGALLERIVEGSSCTVMLIEHDMEFVRQVARRGHRVTVLHEGSVLSEGPLDQVQADERVIEAYLGRGRVRKALTGAGEGTDVLAVKDLDVAYGDSRVLANLNLTVGPGEVVCVMGRNGVGKTTLLKTIVGLLRPRRGSIEFAGTRVTHLAPDARARLGLGYVPQGRDIFPMLSVRENILVGARRKRPPAGALDYVLSLFPALEALLGKRGGDLSGGQQQQLALARVLIADPSLLLLDEPTEGIQPSIVEQIADVLERIKREGRRSILLVEQYLEFAWSIGDRFYVMDKGGVAFESDRAGLSLDDITTHLSV